LLASTAISFEGLRAAKTRTYPQFRAAWVSLALTGFLLFGFIAAAQPSELPRLPILYTTIAACCMWGAWSLHTPPRQPN